MKIDKVAIDGFKGRRSVHQLARANLICGPNGSGKSAIIQSIRYALTGKVPSGLSLDQVARFFPPRGGSVEVYDAEGHWIQRGILKDAEKAKVSESLLTSDTKEGEEPDLTRWRAEGAVLDLSEFLGLSANLRREYLLKLIGESAATNDQLLEILKNEFARELGGPASPPAILDAPERYRLDEGITAICHAWSRPRGIKEVVASYIIAGASLTATSLKLGEVSKESRLVAAKSAKDARSALRELEVEAKGAAAAKLEVDTIKLLIPPTEEAYAKARALHAQQGEAERAKVAADAALAAAVKTELSATLALSEIEPPGPEPVAPDVSGRREPLMRSIHSAEKDLSERRSRENSNNQQFAREAALLRELDAAQTRLHHHTGSPMGKLVAHIGEELQDAGPLAGAWLQTLRGIVRELSASYEAEGEAIAARILAAEEDLASNHNERPTQDGVAELQASIGDVTTRIAGLNRELEAHALTNDVAKHEAAKKRWNNIRTARTNAESRKASAASSLKTAQENADRAWKRCQELGAPSETPCNDAQRSLESLATRLSEAQKRAGALDAYEQARTRAENQKVLEAAWKLFEIALKRVREKLVGGAAAPLMATVGIVLEEAHRTETPYLELENERGKPIFELGWIRGGERIALESLSDGESAVFCTALGLALALIAPGVKALFLEADTLDPHNLRSVLDSITPFADSLDCCVVATSRVLNGDAPAPGWTVIDPRLS